MTAEPREPGRLQTRLLQFDYLLLLFVLLTTGFGLVVLYGSTHDVAGLENYARLQARWWAVSLLVFALSLTVSYRWLRVAGWLLYFVSIVALAMLVLADRKGWDFGGIVVSRKGATSWFKLSLPGLGSMLVQPSEFTKISIAIVMAHWLAWRREKLRNLWECVVPLGLMALPMLLVCLQPDLGTAMVFFPLPFILLFAAGLRWKIVLAGVPVGIAILAGGLYYLSTAEKVPFLRPHQMARIHVFMEPVTQALNPLAGIFSPPGVEEVLYGPPPGKSDGEENAGSGKKTRILKNWQIDQAEMALGSGQVFGKGWGKGKSTRWGFLPDHWTDFIFSTLGEQFGLAGCLALLGLYLLITWRALYIAVAATDPFGKLLVVGLLSVVLLHVYFNIGMSMRLLPVAGLPLPLMSYGGSFLVTNYLIFGLIANVSMRRDEYQPS